MARLDTDKMSADFAAHAAQYANGLTTWAGEQWVIRTENALVNLEEHQRWVLDYVFTRDEHGRFPYETILWGEPKKSGKTEIGGMSGLWYLLTERGLPECFAVANDRDQARARAFGAMTQVISKNPTLGELRVVKDRIDVMTPSLMRPGHFIPSGAFFETVPQDYGGSAGANQAFTLWDELWAYTKESAYRLWEEFTPVPTLRNSLRLVTTYAGWREESELLWNLYRMIVKKGRKIPNPFGLELYESKDGRAFAFWSHTPRMPWQTDAYYAQQKLVLRPNAYKRLHRNMWTSSESVFVTGAQWEALPRWPRPSPTKPYPVYVGLDAAHKRDCIAGVAVAFIDGAPKLVRHIIVKPDPARHITPESVLFPWLARLDAEFRVCGIRYDPAHFESAGQALALRYGADVVEEWTQTGAHLTLMGQSLYGHIFYASLTVYEEGIDDLTEHVLNAVAVESERGFRIAKRTARKKMDGAIALAEATQMCDERGANDAGTDSPLTVVRGADAESQMEEEVGRYPWVKEVERW